MNNEAVTRMLLRGQHILDDNRANEKSRETISQQLEIAKARLEQNKKEYDVSTHAIELLNGISDGVVVEALGFLEKEINTALDKMFANNKRRIKIREGLVRNQYPQLTLDVVTDTGVVRSLKSDSGHGLAQVVSLLSILSLIVITGSRRFLILDEVLSGVSERNREIIDEILWAFADIGFQFVVTEHGYIPKGSHVYEFEMTGNVSSIKSDYIYNADSSDDEDYEEEEIGA